MTAVVRCPLSSHHVSHLGSLLSWGVLNTKKPTTKSTTNAMPIHDPTRLSSSFVLIRRAPLCVAQPQRLVTPARSLLLPPNRRQKCSSARASGDSPDLGAGRDPSVKGARCRQPSICRREGLDGWRRGYQNPRGQKRRSPAPGPPPRRGFFRSRAGANRVVVREAITRALRTADSEGMTDTMVYMLKQRDHWARQHARLAQRRARHGERQCRHRR